MVSEPILPLHGLLLVNWMRFSGQSTEHSELQSQPLPDKIMEQVKKNVFSKVYVSALPWQWLYAEGSCFFLEHL